MKAMQFHEPGPAEDRRLSLTNLPIPEPAAGEVLLRVLACGVCHTDLHTVEGEIQPPSLPVVPGHQAVGVVEAVGPGRGSQLKPGDRVGVPWLYSACGSCEFCRRGLENLCPNARFTGFHMDGGYAEYMLARGDFALPIPTKIPDDQAAPLLCAGMIGYRSLRLADLQPGERLGLVGFGASAHLAIQVARHWNCEVYVFTRSPQHRRHAEALGAAWTGGVEDQPPAFLDRAVIFAPSGGLVPLTLAKIRPAGTLAINAIHMTPIPEMSYDLIYGERTLRSVSNLTRQDGVEFLRLASEIPIRSTVTHYPLDEANQALLDVKHSRLNGEAVLLIG